MIFAFLRGWAGLFALAAAAAAFLRLWLRVLEHREGDAQRTGLYGEHAVLPAQVCAEGTQQQQHQ